jgi:hypothetical protein
MFSFDKTKMSRKMLFILAVALLLPGVAHGAEWQVDTVFGRVESGELALQNYITLALNAIYYIIGFVTILRVIMGGYRYMQANGNPGEAAEAKHTIRHAVSGLVLVLSAYLITNLFM